MDISEFVILSVLIILLVLMLILVGRYVYVTGLCLESGYHKGSIDYRLRGYCARMEKGTQIVVPLNDAMKENNE